jgi:TetR/AcrR family transcriptional regulator, transcriptional repressor for nem operon
MRKGEKTRQYIIEKSAELFNLKGYAGSSIQDIIEVTGLTKGGIYRAFSGKDEIASEAFKYAGKVLMEKFERAAEAAESSTDKIMAICGVHRDPVNNPPIEGGCPLLNTAVEADDGYVFLRGEALNAHSRFTDLIRRILLSGIASGEYQSDLDAEAVASFVVSSLEGGVMTSRLTRDNKHVEFVIRQIGLVLTSHKR